MKPEVGPGCRGRIHSGRRRSSGLRRRIRVRPSLTYKQNLVSSLMTKERHFSLQSILSRHQSSYVWLFRGVSGNLARGTCDLSLAAIRRFPMVLDDTASATCARIISLQGVPVATALLIMRQSLPAFVPRGRAGPVLRPLLKATHHRYIVPNWNPSICPSSFSQTYSATPFK